MVNSATILFPVLAFILLLKAIAVPVRTLVWFAVHSGNGLLCLWILNGIGDFSLPVNAVTVAVAAFGGLPGIGLIYLLSVL